MSGRDSRQDFRAHVAALESAIRCVTYAPLTIVGSHGPRFEVGTEYSVNLNSFRPVLIDATPPIALRAAQQVRFTGAVESSAGVKIDIIKYAYALLLPDGTEILSFHWAPTDSGDVPFPHMHVGRAVVSEQSRILPETFHKIHVPTGRVPLSAVVRLAIVEFRARPLSPRWASMLDDADAVLNA